MIKYFGGNNITNMRMSGYENDILLGSVTFLYQNKRNVMSLLQAGVVSVSSTNKEIWFM